jgi:hypothetical protein
MLKYKASMSSGRNFGWSATVGNDLAPTLYVRKPQESRPKFKLEEYATDRRTFSSAGDFTALHHVLVPEKISANSGRLDR